MQSYRQSRWEACLLMWVQTTPIFPPGLSFFQHIQLRLIKLHLLPYERLEIWCDGLLNQLLLSGDIEQGKEVLAPHRIPSCLRNAWDFMAQGGAKSPSRPQCFMIVSCCLQKLCHLIQFKTAFLFVMAKQSPRNAHMWHFLITVKLSVASLVTSLPEGGHL